MARLRREHVDRDLLDRTDVEAWVTGDEQADVAAVVAALPDPAAADRLHAIDVMASYRWMSTPDTDRTELADQAVRGLARRRRDAYREQVTGRG